MWFCSAEEASISTKPEAIDDQIEVSDSDGEESSDSDDDVEGKKAGEQPTDIRYCIITLMTFGNEMRTLFLYHTA